MNRAVIKVPRLPTLSARLPQIRAPTIIPAKAIAPEEKQIHNSTTVHQICDGSVYYKYG